MSSDKPREWWMEARPYSTEDWVWVGYTGGPNNPSAIRTIEYSAYQAVVAERDEAVAEKEKCIKKHDENITVLKAFQDIFKQYEPEMAKLTEERDEYALAAAAEADMCDQLRTKAEGLKAALEKLPERILCIDTYDEESEKDLMECVDLLREALKAYVEG